VASVQAEVGEHQVEQRDEVGPGHDLEYAFIGFLNFDPFDALEVAIIARSIFYEVLAEEEGGEGLVVLVLFPDGLHLCGREEGGNVGVVPVLYFVQRGLGSQRTVSLDVMAQLLQHGRDADVGLPGGQLPYSAHVLVGFM
jgi:hypothetical protein